MNFGAMLPDVKASLPVSGQHVSADLHAVERACVPGIEADCAHSPFTSIMVRPIYIFPVLPICLQEDWCGTMWNIPRPTTVKYSACAPAELSNAAAAPLTTMQHCQWHHSWWQLCAVQALPCIPKIALEPPGAFGLQAGNALRCMCRCMAGPHLLAPS